MKTRETEHYRVEGEYEDGSIWTTEPFEDYSETQGTPLEQAQSYLAEVTGPDAVAPSARSHSRLVRGMTAKGRLMPNRWLKIRRREVTLVLGDWVDL